MKIERFFRGTGDLFGIGRFLLTQTMEAPQPPDNVTGIDPRHLPAGKTTGDDLQRLLIFVALEDGHDNGSVSNMCIGIGGSSRR